MSTPPRITWLGDPASDDPNLAGPKAATLSRLARTYLVPAGFCVTADALAELAGNHSLDVVLPASLERDIHRAYGVLGARVGELEPRVAVRSSGVSEDGQGASFAGQHETYLNVRGAKRVSDAVGRCWRSLFAESAVEYRRQRGLSMTDARLAVLVQSLVDATASAVVFSANPVTNSRDSAVLISTPGLGESLVGGRVSPDTYVVRKSDLAIESRVIAVKRRMTVLTEDGTDDIEIPAERQEFPAISDAQVAEAVRTAVELEATFGWPVDIECAWMRDRLHLLQCRPITTLAAVKPAGTAQPGAPRGRTHD